MENRMDDLEKDLKTIENCYDEAMEEAYYSIVKEKYPNIDLSKAIGIENMKRIFCFVILIISSICAMACMFYMVFFIPENSHFSTYIPSLVCLIGFLSVLLILHILYLLEKLFIHTDYF